MEYESTYYSVIPADVRYDPDLPPNAKLLYGEITSLTNKNGYCWATNDYFAKLYNLSVKSISRLIGLLNEKGYILCEMASTEKGSERRIYAGMFLVTPVGMDKNADTPEDGMDIFAETRLRKNVHQNNKKENNKQEKEKRNKKEKEPKSEPDWKPERFADFWRAYPCGKSKQAAIKAWDKLKPDEALLTEMARGLKRDLESDLWKRGVGIPYASSWLNGRRWEDEEKAPPAVEAPAVVPAPGNWGWD